MLGLTQIIFAFNFFYSLFAGPKAGDNPWHANTLEWADLVAPAALQLRAHSRSSTTARTSTACPESRTITCPRPQPRPAGTVRSTR